MKKKSNYSQIASDIENLVSTIRAELGIKTEGARIGKSTISPATKTKIQTLVLKSNLKMDFVCQVLGVQKNIFK